MNAQSILQSESLGALRNQVRTLAVKDPIDTVVTVVLGGSYLFYLAEKGKNPKVKSFYDALVFISTCLSVGYSDTFARTNSGKAIAAFVMTFGPSISARALDPPLAAPAVTAAPAAPAQSQSTSVLEGGGGGTGRSL